MARILGIDPGSKRVGLAVSDPEGITSQPLEVIDAVDVSACVSAIAERVRELDVAEIVVGIPLRLDGTRGPEAQAAESFAVLVETETKIPVRRWDERLSTKQAERSMRAAGANARKQRGVVDKVAASIVLASYLESRRAR